MKKSLIAEIILFIILLSVLAFLGFKIFKHTFDIGTTYHVEFNDIDNIVVGSPVRILGVDIGHVTKIQTGYDKIYIDFIVTNDNIKIPQGTKATIEFFGIAGSRSIELTPPDKDSDEKGIIVSNPIRIGDAFSIMEEFLRATMASIAGAYEFAKNRTQEDAIRDTTHILNVTNETDDKIANVTSEIEKGGAKLHSGLESTTRGMSRIYDETSVFNFGENVNRAKYGIKIAKRSLKKTHKNIKELNKNLEFKIGKMNIQYEKIKNVKNNAQTIDKINKAFENLSKSLENLDKDLSQENLDKVYDSFENLRLQSAELEKAI